MKSSFKKSKKYLLALCLSALIATGGIGALTACSDDESTDSSTTESSSSSTETSVNDTSLVTNGGFETFNTNNGLNAIGTSVTGWTRSVNSTSSGSALTSRSASGIIDTSSAAWEKLTGKNNGDMSKLSEEDAKNIWSKLSVAEKLAYYDAWKKANDDGTISNDLDFYEAFNIDSEDIPTVANPGTHHTNDENKDTKVLMIHNEYPSTSDSSTYKTLGTAQKYTSSSTVTVPAGTSAEFSVWVKTADLMCSSTSGASQKAIGKGAYISVSQSVGSKSLPVFTVENINTEYMEDGTVAAEDYSNGWVKYSFSLKGSSYASTTFSIVLGLGQGGGENRGEYVNGYAFFDDIQCNIISNEAYDEYENEHFPSATAKDENVITIDTELKDKTIDASKEASKNKFAFNFYGEFLNSTLLDSFVGKSEEATKDHFAATSTKKGDKEYTSEAGNTPFDALNGGLDSTYDVKGVFAGTSSIANIENNKYLAQVYTNYFADDTYATNKNILLLMSANGVAYTADTAYNATSQLGYTFSYADFKNDNLETTEVEYEDYLAISFFVKTSDLNGFTGAGITLVNGNNKTSFSSLDTSSISPISIGTKGETGYIEDLYSGWQQCFFFVKNDYVEADKSNVQFSLSFTYGPTTITGTTVDSYYEGFAAFTDFKVRPMSKSEYDSVSTSTYAKTVSVSGVTEETAQGNNGFDSAANVPSDALKSGLAPLKNYTGVYSDSYYVNQKNGTSTGVNLNANAGLLNREYFIGTEDDASYYTSAATAPAWMAGLTNISNKTTAKAVWENIFGYNNGLGSSTQPLLIWNDGSKNNAYGFIGASTAISANSYTKVSVSVKLGAASNVDTSNFAAYIYLIDTSDDSYSNTLSIGRNLTYWYDEEGNICTGDPSKKDTEVALYLQNNGLYKANENWSGYAELADKNAYYANIGSYTKKDSAGNLLVAENGASHAYNDKWNNVGENGIAFYYNKDTKSYFADEAMSIPVSDVASLSALAPRYSKLENDKQLMAKVSYIAPADGTDTTVWQTISFYIHTGERAKSYRLEVWSGERNGAANPANTFVAFDMNYSGDAQSNFTTLIDENKDNKDATVVESVFSYFDSDKHLRYNADLDENKVGNVYEKSYNATEQTSGVAYLAYTEDYETRIFADYSYSDKTVAATIKTDNDTSDSTEEEKDSDSDVNVWLLVSSIAVAAVLVLAVASIALQKAWKKAKKVFVKKAPAKAKKEKAVKVKKTETKKVDVDEDSPYND